jgi:hypothetical protein
LVVVVLRLQKEATQYLAQLHQLVAAMPYRVVIRGKQVVQVVALVQM